MEKVVLHLGSNKSDRIGFLNQATDLITSGIGQVVQRSMHYETEAWGLKDQDDFINQTIIVETSLSPEALIKKTKEIEEIIGRDKTEKWGPRNIDIDILIYGEKEVTLNDLIIPHPKIAQRNFVLIPLMELLPEFVLPGFDLTVEELYDLCKDDCEVSIYESI